MTRGRLYTASLLLLLATSPWPFWSLDTRVLWGLPPWAVYSLAMTALYAASMAWFLKRYWRLSARTEEDDGEIGDGAVREPGPRHPGGAS